MERKHFLRVFPVPHRKTFVIKKNKKGKIATRPNKVVLMHNKKKTDTYKILWGTTGLSAYGGYKNVALV